MTIGEQANLAATYKRMPKLKLVGQALDNFLLAEQLNAANQQQGEKINRLTDDLRKAEARVGTPNADIRQAGPDASK